MMAKLNHGHGHWISSSSSSSSSSQRSIISARNPLVHLQSKTQFVPNLIPTSKSPALSRKNHNKYHPQRPWALKKEGRGSRGFITVSFPSGQWAGDWSYDYILTLKDLRLHDLAEDGRKNTQVHINLSIHKHAGFGVSADGRIVTSIARKCSNCSSSYFRQIDTTFNVWVLPSSRDDSSNQLPELGGGDPSLTYLIPHELNVVYVKPGDDAVLDSFIQEAVRLQILVKETCSDACEKADTKLHFIGVQKTASLDRRWSKLRDYKNTYLSLSQRDE